MSRFPSRSIGGDAGAKNGEAAVGLRSSSTLVGLHFASMAAAASGFAGSAPVAGKVQLEGIWLGSAIAPATGTFHELQLALATEIPANQGDVDAGEQLFPRASTKAGESSTVFFYGWAAGWLIPLTTVVSMNGRRFIGRVKNLNGTTAAEFYVALAMHRIYGGASSGDPAFLSGEEVVDR